MWNTWQGRHCAIDTFTPDTGVCDMPNSVLFESREQVGLYKLAEQRARLAELAEEAMLILGATQIFLPFRELRRYKELRNELDRLCGSSES